MDLLGLVPAQLHPFALRAYLCVCIVFRIALESLDDFYPNHLTAREFLALYNVRALKWGVLNFHKREKGQPLAVLESQYSNANA